MKQQAFHRMILADGTHVSGPVAVRFDENGCATSWHFLEGEEAQTEWIGGTCTLDANNRIDKIEKL